jgi:hypothetical protein
MTESNHIYWRDNKNLVKKKVKKNGYTKLVDQESFFNFFKKVHINNVKQAGKLTMK